MTAKVSLVTGILLAVLGIVAYALTGLESITALIPAFVGIPVGILGWLATRNPPPGYAMPAILVLAGLGFAAAASRLPVLDDYSSLKSISVEAMCLLCGLILAAALISRFKNKKKPSQ